MSLINKVLVDLDQRRAGDANPAEALLADSIAVRTSSAPRTSLIGITAGVFVLLVAALVAYWYLVGSAVVPQATVVIKPQQKVAIILADLPEKLPKPLEQIAPDTLSQDQPEEVQSIEPFVPPVITEPAPEPIHAKLKLQQLRVAKRKVGSRIVFEFDQFPQYQLIEATSKQQLTIVLKETVQTEQSSLMLLRNDLLKDISSHQGESGLSFEFKTYRPVSTYLFLLAATGDYGNRLVIDIAPIEPLQAKPQPVAAPSVRNAAIVEVEIIEREEPAKPNGKKVTKQPKREVLIRKSVAQKTERTYQQALDQLADGKQNAAIETFNLVLENEPTHQEARYSLVALLIQRKARVEAEALLLEGLRQAPQYAPFAKLYGHLKAESGEYLQAVTVMERAIGNATTDADYYGQMAALYQRLEFHPQAIDAYTIALRLKPSMALWWMGKAISLEQGRYYKEALSGYKKALANGRLNADAQRFVESRVDLLKP
jgi:Tfp pilus assembly protein PilF